MSTQSTQSKIAQQTRSTFKWLKPDISPLAAAIVLALGFCGYSLARNLATNPDIYIRKDRRSDYDDSAGERMRRQAEAYGTRSVFRSFGHIQGGRHSGFWKEVEKKKAEGKSEETAVAEVVQQIKQDVKEQS